VTVTLLKPDCGLRLFNGPMTPPSSSPRMPTYAFAWNRRANTAARPSGSAPNAGDDPKLAAKLRIEERGLEAGPDGNQTGPGAEQDCRGPRDYFPSAH
jgi:hypothetical protein